MNIKAKLIEQLEVLEGIQTKAMENGQYLAAVDVSKVILDYITVIDRTEPGDTDVDEEDDSVCPEYFKEEMEKETLKRIANASDMPIEIVKRVLAGQAEVMELD